MQALNGLTALRDAPERLIAGREAFDDADEYVRGAARYLAMIDDGGYTPERPIWAADGHDLESVFRSPFDD